MSLMLVSRHEPYPLLLDKYVVSYKVILSIPEDSLAKNYENVNDLYIELEVPKSEYKNEQVQEIIRWSRLPARDPHYYRDIAIHLVVMGGFERSIVFSHGRISCERTADTEADFETVKIFVSQKEDRYEGVVFGTDLDVTYAKAWKMLKPKPTVVLQNLALLDAPMSFMSTQIGENTNTLFRKKAEILVSWIKPKKKGLDLMGFTPGASPNQTVEYNQKGNGEIAFITNTVTTMTLTYNRSNNKYESEDKEISNSPNYLYGIGYRRSSPTSFERELGMLTLKFSGETTQHDAYIYKGKCYIINGKKFLESFRYGVDDSPASEYILKGSSDGKLYSTSIPKINYMGEQLNNIELDDTCKLLGRSGWPGIDIECTWEKIEDASKDTEEYIDNNDIGVIDVANRDSQIAFLKSILNGSVSEYLRTGIPWQVTMAQAAQETGWGKSSIIDIYTGKDSNNLYGIKYTGSKSNTNEFVRIWTSEYIEDSELSYWKQEQSKWALNGEALINTGERDGESKLKIKVVQPFKVYPTKDASIVGHSQTLGNDVYKEAMKYTDDPYKFLKEISGIYATDPNYYENVSSIITKYLTWNGK